MTFDPGKKKDLEEYDSVRAKLPEPPTRYRFPRIEEENRERESEENRDSCVIFAEKVIYHVFPSRPSL